MSENISYRTQLAYIVAAECQARNITPQQFARLAGIAAETVSEILTGQHNSISDSVLEKLEAVTDVPLADLRDASELPIDRTQYDSSVPVIEGMSVLYTAKSIERCVNQLAQTISDHFEDRPFIVICILSGAWMFVADLVRKIGSRNVEVEFIRTSRFQPGNEDSSEMNVIWDVMINIKNKEILVVDELSDTGETLEFVVEHLWKKEPKNIRTCTLLNKTAKRPRKDGIDFSGLNAPNSLLVGYGMDSSFGSRQVHRNNPDILVIESPDSSAHD